MRRFIDDGKRRHIPWQVFGRTCGNKVAPLQRQGDHRSRRDIKAAEYRQATARKDNLNVFKHTLYVLSRPAYVLGKDHVPENP